MKITVVTIYDPTPNYGNRLQNYAVQHVLENMGCDVTTLSFEKENITFLMKLKYLVHRITFYHLTNSKNFWKLFYKKVLKFREFNKRYINTTRINNIGDIKQSDYYVLGSDQVWNPSWYSSSALKKDLFLLTFCEDNKKVCFSPSFGVTSIPIEWVTWFKEYLGKIPHLSVREEAGAKIIRELTGKDADVLIDPTLMLSAADWNKIAETPKNIDCNKKYVLTYFLGGRSERVNAELKKYKNMGYEVYNLLDESQPNVYITNPSHFIYLVSHADLILTDSFHACVFSFIYDKPFLVYSREGSERSMMSRLDTLLSKFDIQRKYIDSGLNNDVFEHDYAKGKKILSKEQEKVTEFLVKAFGDNLLKIERGKNAS